jgi:hypothetical protein
VHVTACDYNQSIGLLAIALIDREVKIYSIKHTGTKTVVLNEFSFYV